MDSADHFQVAEACARQADVMLKDGDLAEASVVIALGGLHVNLAQALNTTAVASICETYDRAMRMELEAYQARRAATDTPTEEPAP